MPTLTMTRIDALMHELYQRSKGQLHQTLVANYEIADAMRNLPVPGIAGSERLVVRAARTSWWLLSRVLWRTGAIRLGGILWMITGIPELLLQSLRLHDGAFDRAGSTAATALLLRTGVANEPRIAQWIETKHGESVQMLQLNETPGLRVSALRFLPALLGLHIALCLNTLRTICSIVEAGVFTEQEVDAAIPVWFVLLARRSLAISSSHIWARQHLQAHAPKKLYFTFNYSRENAFMLALPGVPAACVEHGFPRRDIPPLGCKQYVYSGGYQHYLQTFDKSLDVEVIGLDYFAKGDIKAARTIVVASLQDWPQYKVERCRAAFNAALDAARSNNWRLVFRTRRYDSDAFARELSGPWHEISLAENESFQQCLARTRPCMVWTTWSTAVLDASAMNVVPIAFITQELHELFMTDIETFAWTVADNVALEELCKLLGSTDCDYLKQVLAARVPALVNRD